MSYEEEFDKIVRDKVGQAEYHFDENHWAKTSQLIDADRAAVNKGFWKKFILPAVVVVGSLATYVVLQDNEGHKGVADQTQQTSELPNLQAQVAPMASGTDYPSQETASSSAANADVSAPSAKQENTGVTPGKSETLNENLTSSESKSESRTVIASSKPKAATSPASVTDPEDRSIPEQNSDVASGTTGNKSGEGNYPASKQPETVPAGVPAAVGAAGVEKPQPNSSDETPASNIENELVASLEADVLVANQTILPYASQKTDATMPFVLLKRYDEDYFSEKAKTHFLNAEFGGTYLFGWNTSQGTDGEGLNWFAGVNYGYYLGKFSIGAGLQAYNISNMNEAFHSVERKEYSFGLSTSYTTVTTSDMLFLSVPLRFAYHLNRSNHFGIGFNAGYLVKMNNVVKRYSVDDELTPQPVPDEKNNTMYEGVRSLNYMGSLFYNARLSNRFAVHGEFMYSFTDLFENSGKINNAEQPVGLRLGVQYYLFDK